MNDLNNCPECGKLFIKTAWQSICNDCRKIEDKQFETARNFIRQKKNRMATLLEVAEETGVPESKIQQFIREGKLIVSSMPNMGYTCDRCNTVIKRGKYCTKCQEKLKHGIEGLKKEAEKPKPSSESHTYYSFKDEE